MSSLFNIPANKIRSEWVHVRSGLVGWKRLCLFECDDSCLYFCQVWEPVPQISVSLAQVSDVIDCQVLNPDKKGMECRIDLKFQKTNQPLISRLMMVRYLSLSRLLASALVILETNDFLGL